MGAKVVCFPKKTVDFACQPPYIDLSISGISGISGMLIRLFSLLCYPGLWEGGVKGRTTMRGAGKHGW